MNFVFENEEDEELDLSDLITEDKDFSPKISPNLQFEEDIPDRKSLQDPEVREKASSSRKASKVNKEELLSKGYSFYCAAQPFNEYEFDRNKPHYSTLCEKDQDRGEISCTCPCHDIRGYARPKPEHLSGSDDEEIILLID